MIERVKFLVVSTIRSVPGSIYQGSPVPAFAGVCIHASHRTQKIDRGQLPDAKDQACCR